MRLATSSSRVATTGVPPEAHFDPQSGIVVAELDTGIVMARNRLNKAQAKPVAGHASTRIETEEALEHTIAQGFRNAGSSVTDGEVDVFADVIEAGAAILKDGDFDCLIALGGGSPMDTAKAMNVLAKKIGLGRKPKKKKK